MLNKKYVLALSCAGLLAACSPKGDEVGGGVSEETNNLAGILVDLSGKPVAGAAVLAKHVSLDSESFSDTTDAEGKFGFALKKRGNYALSSVSDTLAVYKTISFDGSDLNLDLALGKTINLKGQVSDYEFRSGKVNVSLPGSSWKVNVDSLGEFEFTGIPENTQALLVSTSDKNHTNSSYALYPSDSSLLLVGPLPADFVYSIDEVDLSTAVEFAESSEGDAVCLPVIQDYGLLSMWSMDYFKKVDETKATTQDSRNQTEAAVVYGPECFVSVKSGRVVHFESASQFGVVENDNGILDSLTEMTLEVLIKIDSVQEQEPFRRNMVGKLGFGTEDDNDVFSLALINKECGVNVPSVAFFLADGSGDSLSCENAVVASDSVEFGSWVSYVATWDGDKLSLYKNGLLNATKQVSITLLNPSKEPIFFGKEDINFMLDDVRLGAKAINSADVLYRYYLRGGSL